METTNYQPTIEMMQAQKVGVQFVINGGGQWDETNSRMHCCEVIYRDTRYIQHSLKTWALTIREAYELAVAAWNTERSEGRAL